MARRIITKVSIGEVVFDETIYPRVGYNWQTGYDYSQSIVSGAKLPPITLALYRGKKYLIDGKHRLEAHKILKKKTISAEIFTGWSKERMFEESITRNIAHGKVLSPFEKRRIALKLKQMKYSSFKIGKLLNIPETKLEKFIAQRLINSITGEVISESIIKSAIKHSAGNTYNESDFAKIQEDQQGFYSRDQIQMLDELIEIIEGGLIDFNKKGISERIARLSELLQAITISIEQ